MPTSSRRGFFRNAGAAGLLVAGVRGLHANPLGLPIGCQTWPVRDMIKKDFPARSKCWRAMDSR